MITNYGELPNDRASLDQWITDTLGSDENTPGIGNISGQNWRQLIQTNPAVAAQVAEFQNAMPIGSGGGQGMGRYQNEINRLKQQGISFDEPAPPAEAAVSPVVNAPLNFGDLFPNQNLGMPNVGDRYGFLDQLAGRMQGRPLQTQGGGPFQRQVIDNNPQDWGQGGGQGGMPPQFLKVLQELMSRLGGRDFNPNTATM